MKKLSILLTGLLLLSGHAVRAQRDNTRVNENYWYNSTAARNLEASHEMLVTPLLADVEIRKENGVEKRVTWEKEYRVDISATDTWKAQTIDQLKRQALFDVTNDYDADVIVGALISAQTVDENDDGMTDRAGDQYKVMIRIIGYPANYRNFRPAKQTDRWIKDQLLDKNGNQNAAVTNSQSGTVTKGQKTVVVH